MSNADEFEHPLGIDQVLADELSHWKPLRPDAAQQPRGALDEASQDAVQRLHEARPAALCLSGGGIRSATFGLGVLQGLARKGLLKEFDYLSTVSGGGYIGSWLISWIKRLTDETDDARAAADTVFTRLAEGDDKHRYENGGEAEEIRHLRTYSNYLTPKLGLLSVDTWTLAATYLRNVIVNWFVLIPFLLAGLALPRIAMAAVAGRTLSVGSAAILLAIAFVTGFLLVIYLSSVRPVPGAPASSKARYGWRFALFGPAMLVIQALAMCSVRAMQDVATGNESDATWFKATWAYTTWLPFHTQVRAGFEWLVKALPVDQAELLVSLMFAVVILNCIGWAIYVFRMRRTANDIVLRAGVELAAAIVAGASAGWFLWLIIVKIFPDPLMFVGLMPRSGAQLLPEYFVCFAPALYLFAFFVQTMIFVGLTGKLNDDDDREWWARWAGWLLIVSVSFVVVSSIAVFGPLLIAKLPRLIAALGGVSGVVTLTLGRSGTSAATAGQKTEKTPTAILSRYGLAAATPVFVVIVASSLSYLNTWFLGLLNAPGLYAGEQLMLAAHETLERAGIAHFVLLRRTPFELVAVYTASLLALSVLASFAVQINRFSIHGLYRNRLTRAYLGASHVPRHPNPFTGFDPHDNIAEEELPKRPFHVVNVALNLVSGNNLAWQERKAAAFTISPLHCGSSLLGFRRSCDYSKQKGSAHGISLGTAVAISGAAVSPNMGYHSSPALSFLLTLFNVRLGWWLGNPKKRHYAAIGPYSSLMTILSEAFGKTDSESSWIYLSDGGHFENLGVYEMVRRRCHYIVVSDAGRDPKITFEDLGNAIRKIRIDLGIPITIDDVKIFPRDEKKPGRYFAVGTIHYEVKDDGAKPGVLIYLKPCIYGKEPIDVRNYASQNDEFPHESTSDQWFTESQFESYRALGAWVIEEICGNETVRSLQDLVNVLDRHMGKRREPHITEGLRQPSVPAH